MSIHLRNIFTFFFFFASTLQGSLAEVSYENFNAKVKLDDFKTPDYSDSAAFKEAQENLSLKNGEKEQEQKSKDDAIAARRLGIAGKSMSKAQKLPMTLKDLNDPRIRLQRLESFGVQYKDVEIEIVETGDTIYEGSIVDLIEQTRLEIHSLGLSSKDGKLGCDGNGIPKDEKIYSCNLFQGSDLGKENSELESIASHLLRGVSPGDVASKFSDKNTCEKCLKESFEILYPNKNLEEEKKSVLEQVRIRQILEKYKKLQFASNVLSSYYEKFKDNEQIKELIQSEMEHKKVTRQEAIEMWTCKRKLKRIPTERKTRNCAKANAMIAMITEEKNIRKEEMYRNQCIFGMQDEDSTTAKAQKLTDDQIAISLFNEDFEFKQFMKEPSAKRSLKQAEELVVGFLAHDNLKMKDGVCEISKNKKANIDDLQVYLEKEWYRYTNGKVSGKLISAVVKNNPEVFTIISNPSFLCDFYNRVDEKVRIDEGMSLENAFLSEIANSSGTLTGDIILPFLRLNASLCPQEEIENYLNELCSSDNARGPNESLKDFLGINPASYYYNITPSMQSAASLLNCQTKFEVDPYEVKTSEDSDQSFYGAVQAMKSSRESNPEKNTIGRKFGQLQDILNNSNSAEEAIKKIVSTDGLSDIGESFTESSSYNQSSSQVSEIDEAQSQSITNQPDYDIENTIADNVQSIADTISNSDDSALRNQYSDVISQFSSKLEPSGSSSETRNATELVQDYIAGNNTDIKDKNLLCDVEDREVCEKEDKELLEELDDLKSKVQKEVAATQVESAKTKTKENEEKIAELEKELEAYKTRSKSNFRYSSASTSLGSGSSSSDFVDLSKAPSFSSKSSGVSRGPASTYDNQVLKDERVNPDKISNQFVENPEVYKKEMSFTSGESGGLYLSLSEGNVTKDALINVTGYYLDENGKISTIRIEGIEKLVPVTDLSDDSYAALTEFLQNKNLEVAEEIKREIASVEEEQEDLQKQTVRYLDFLDDTTVPAE